MSRVLRPKVYVDYEREPYVLPSGDVRITLDRDVRSAPPGGEIDGSDKAFLHVLDPGKLVLEVKFTEFLPRMVSEALPLRAVDYSAVSKFQLGCDKIKYMETHEGE